MQTLAKSQGTKANASGQELETMLAGLLKRAGLYVAQQVYIGLSIYGEPMYADLKVYGFSEYPDGLLIECKWQMTSGSVDQKFPFLVANIKEKYPLPTVVILDGGGYTRGAEQWLRSQIGGTLVTVLNLQEFIAWIHAVTGAGNIVKQTLC